MRIDAAHLNPGYDDRPRPSSSQTSRVYILVLLVDSGPWTCLLVPYTLCSFGLGLNSELFSLTSALQTHCSLFAKPQSVTMHH